MKYLIQIFVFLVVTQSGAQNFNLKLASNIWPPFTNTDEKSAVAMDIVSEALERSNISVSNKVMVFEDVLTSISEGLVDGSPALWKSDEREEYMFFSEPYLFNQLILVGKKGSKVNVSEFLELEGKKVALVGSYAYGEKTQGIDQVDFISGKNDQENLSKLLKGKVDYMLVDALLIQFLLKYQADDVNKHLEIGNKPLVVRSLHFGIRKDYANAEKIISDFNAQIATMKEDGSYNRILHLNWIRTDIDGDGKMELVLSGTNAGTNAPISSYSLNSNPVMEDDSVGYFIDGKRYTNWDHVPAQYKVEIQPIRYDFDLMSFNF